MKDSHHQLLAQIGSMYYEQEKSQNDIADELGLSRVKVYRLLKEARENNIVKIVIGWPIERDNAVEKQLCDVFNLKKALVLSSKNTDETVILSRLGQMTANFLETILEDGMTLAVCLGRSTYEVINAVKPTSQVHVNVAQAMGSIPFALQDIDSAALARQLAQKLGGQVLYLTSPLMANSPEEAAVLRRQKSIELTLNASRKADILLLGIGNLDPNNSRYVQADMISADQIKIMKKDGTVGDIGGLFFCLDGSFHQCHINQSIIGLTMEEMKQIPNTIAVAMGLKKTRAILGALKTGVIKILSTDIETATAVLKMENETQK